MDDHGWLLLGRGFLSIVGVPRAEPWKSSLLTRREWQYPAYSLGCAAGILAVTASRTAPRRHRLFCLIHRTRTAPAHRPVDARQM